MYASPARLDLHAHDTDVRRIDIDKVENFLESGQRDQCVNAVDTIFDEVGYAALESFMLRLYITMDIYVCARTFSKRFGISGEEFTKQFGTIDDMPRNLFCCDVPLSTGPPNEYPFLQSRRSPFK